MAGQCPRVDVHAMTQHRFKASLQNEGGQKAGAQAGRESETGTEAETVGERCLPVCSSGSYSLATLFFI